MHQALADASRRAPGYLQRPVGGGVRREALAQRHLDLGDLRSGPAQHRVVEAAREVERRVPQLLEARVAAREVERLDVHVGETRLLEQLGHPRGAPQREGPRPLLGLLARRRRQPTLDQLLRGKQRPGVAYDRIPDRQRDPPAGAQHAPRLRERRGRVGHQHVAPPAQHGVDACDRQVDPFRVEHLKLDVAEAKCERPRAGALEHRLSLVGDDHATQRSDQLCREHPRLSQTGGQLEHALAGPQGDGVDHPLGHRSPELAQELLAAHPPRGRLFPALQAGAAVCVRVEAHRSSLRSSLPERVRGSGSAASTKRLGTL